MSKMRMEPGHSNLRKIHKTSEEDQVIGEGKIYYDIRFSVYFGADLMKILINIEAQKSTNPSKLGYHIDNRVIYYLGRMISSQKEVEFQNSHYDDLKAVRSIWICMDSDDDEDSINRIRFIQEKVFGKKMDLDNLDKVQGVIIRLRKNEDAETSKNVLIAMLEELIKKKKLEEKFDIVMDVETERRINTMCNLSEVVLERGMEQGIERKLIDLVCKKITKGYNLEQIADLLEEDITVIQPIFDLALEQKPDYNVDLILQALQP